MSPRPPFDPVRGAFWMVAAILAAQTFIVLAGVIVCVWQISRVPPGAFVCDKEGRLGDLLAEALAAAIAFSGGLRSRLPDPPAPPPKPEGQKTPPSEAVGFPVPPPPARDD